MDGGKQNINSTSSALLSAVSSNLTSSGPVIAFGLALLLIPLFSYKLWLTSFATLVAQAVTP